MHSMSTKHAFNRKEPMRAREAPTQQIMKVETDVMYCKHSPYLIMADFVEVAKMRDEPQALWLKLAWRYLHSMESHRYYTVSNQFKRFASNCRFEHTTSSSYHFQSNGKPESAVKVVKKFFKIVENL